MVESKKNFQLSILNVCHLGRALGTMALFLVLIAKIRLGQIDVFTKDEHASLLRYSILYDSRKFDEYQP